MDCPNESFDDNISVENLLQQKETRLPSITRSLEDGSQEPSKRLENIKMALNFLPACQIDSVEDELLKHLMPAIIQTFKDIYDENCQISQTTANNVLSCLKHNIKLALTLVEGTSQIFRFLLAQTTVKVSQIQSIPINGALALIITFEHCKISQKQYNTYFDSVSEVLELFRKAQDLHSQFLHFVDARLVFDAACDRDVIILKNLLEIMYRISEVLSGMNIKSMADNWKTFITLTQKYSDVLSSNSFDILPPIKSLSGEIENNLQKILKLGPEDSKTSSHLLKVAGFLCKVVLKLFETYLSELDSYYPDIIQFSTIIFSFPSGLFQTMHFSNDFVASVEATMFQNLELFLTQICHEENFLQVLTSLDDDYSLVTTNSFGFLNLLNKVLQILPTVMMEGGQNDFLDNTFKIEAVINLVFCCVRNCFKDLCLCSTLYNDLVVNIAVSALIFPQKFAQVEIVFLKNLLQDEIWSAMLAMDAWYFVLRNTSASTCYETLSTLLTKSEQLRLMTSFARTAPDIVHLKIFTRRIFTILPDTHKSTILAKFSGNQSSDNAIWTFLDLRKCPLGQRYRLEAILSGLYEMPNMFDDGDIDANFNDYISLCHTLEIVSHIDFNAAQLNSSRLISLVNRLWSFNVNTNETPLPAAGGGGGGGLLLLSSKESNNNRFFKYFVFQLSKLTRTLMIAAQCSGEMILLILSQVKSMLYSTSFKLLACDILRSLASKDMRNVPEKLSIFSVITEILQISLNDCNPVVVQTAWEVFQKFSENNQNYGAVVKKIWENCRQIIQNLVENSADFSLDFSNLGRLQSAKFEHKCPRISEIAGQPAAKKIKFENTVLLTANESARNENFENEPQNCGNDVDEVINSLKSEAKRLGNILKDTKLSSKQSSQLKGVIGRLETLV